MRAAVTKKIFLNAGCRFNWRNQPHVINITRSASHRYQPFHGRFDRCGNNHCPIRSSRSGSKPLGVSICCRFSSLLTRSSYNSELSSFITSSKTCRVLFHAKIPAIVTMILIPHNTGDNPKRSVSGPTIIRGTATAILTALF